ncbi:amino acid adenylation domain-containing protein [Streptomyces sp. XM4193]|uniref:amino acid adenylation domain-containing protein n=1 Tax=Streptomyces sp. XM4193 TaxID=2929782 RepID=UPI001FF72C35|nr:non-ribosomal peptide synthetase [Streptomyces sp. XM4193]MCK1797778.1 amino acid adenylation domain-containing protein [Streptomyces sp. XM4193]
MPENEKSQLPVTSAQKGLWFAQQLDPASPAYNIAEYADVRGEVDVEALTRAVGHVVRETEALRVTFGEQDGRPHQLLHSGLDVPLPVVDLRDGPDPFGEAMRRMRRDLARPADTAAGPLVRVTLYRLERTRFFFHQQVHHLALDGYGAALGLMRIAEVYGQFTSAPHLEVPLRPAPLLPVLEEEREYRDSEKFLADREFWSEYLAGAPEPVGLRDGSAVPAHVFHATGEDRDAQWLERLKHAAKAAGAGWPSMFIAATAAYLHRIRGVGEVVLGLPVTARRTDISRSTPTMLSNVLPLRVEVSPADRVDELLRRTSRQVRTVLRHQRYPAEDLRRDRGLLRRRERLTGPAVNVLAFDDTLAFGPATATLHNLSIGPVEDLVVAAHASFADGGLRLDMLANPDLHTEEQLHAHRGRFLRLLDEFIADPSRHLGAIGLLDAEEHSRITGFAAGPPRAEAVDGQEQVAPGDPAALPVQLSRQAARRPQDVAVVCRGSRLSFAELDSRVDRLAHRLARAGAGAGTRVAVALPRSTELVVAMLAVMRAGAAYLPVEPSYPADRIAFMLADSAPVALVADRATATAADPDGRLVRIDPADDQPPHVESWAPFDAPSGRDAAYVIYTSGSTGTPKGVIVEHRSLSNLLEHHRRESHAGAARSLGRGLRVALTAATSFDAAWDPVLWMVAGHELHIVDDRTRRDPEALVDFLRSRRIDVIETTPSYLQQMLAAGLLADAVHRPRVIALGGEAVNEALWAQLSAHPDLLVFNFYGPTETTVNAVTSRISGGTPVIGRPVSGARAYVLDAGMHPLPVGTAGELYLSGEGVARGYNGRTGLTADRFLPDPFGPAGARMYRTGDLARWREDGSLEFHGRTDGQVKVRGFRVELGEVESALTRLPSVREAAVVARTGPDGLDRLAAYVVLETGDDSAAEGAAPGGARDQGTSAAVALRDLLAAELPDHMVPVLYAVVDRLPLTPNGKLDIAALPEATPPRTGGGEGPRTEREATLCAAFAEALGLDAKSVGRDDDFFAMGGHSLLATRLISGVRSAFGVELPVRALFEAPTPASLAERLEQAAPARAALVATHPRPERIPLSLAQRRLWLLESIGEGGAAYHLPLALRLSGSLDRHALRCALQDLVDRHESLRTVFPEDEQGPRQQVLPPESARLELDVTPAPYGLPPAPGRSPFSLSDSLPVRAELFVLEPTEHVLLLTVHHIAADGWSMGPLLDDLARACAARAEGRAPSWEPLPVQYADHTLWQQRTLGDPDDPRSPLAAQLAHWRSVLEELPAEVTFPVDRVRSVGSGGGGGGVSLVVSPEVHGRVVALGRESGVSVFMVVHAALSALLCRLGGGSDVVVGSPVAGRSDEALAGLVGFFVNTLVLRADVSGDPSFRELLGRVREVDLAAYGNQDVPFERLVEEVGPVRSPARHPLFQVMLALNNTEPPRLELPGLTTRHEPSVGRIGAKFDLTWDLTEHHTAQGAPAGMTGELEYSTDLFDRATAQQFADHFGRLLTAALDEPELPFTELDFLRPAQRRAALDLAPRAPHSDGAGTAVGEAPPCTLTDVFTTQALVAPERTAVVDAEGPVSFGELLQRVEALATRLHEEGIRPGDRVASALPRTTRQIEALLAVLRCGAVHVPLDPTHPVERNRVVLENSRPSCVLVDSSSAGRLPAGGHRLLEVGSHPGDAVGGSAPLRHRPAPHDPAYVLYTSGSTGTPKGVVVEHRSLTRLLAGHRAHLMESAATDDDRPLRVALTAAATFDASWDPILWMVAGHELHLVDDDTRRDPEALTEFVHSHRVDMLETTPSFLEQLRACGLFAAERHRLRLLALGGEPVGEALWNALAAQTDIAVWNLYGPTEATVDSVICRITPGSSPRIGYAVDGTFARVLDARLQPVAPGAPGELYLAGASLARGYERRTALTAERFLPDPHGPPGTRMYRTGDLVRRHPDGSLQYLGRSDDQVKVRGFRVEIAEVEAALLRHPGVVRAAVAVRPDSSGAGALVAWVVRDDGPGRTTEDIRHFAAEQLPGYMVPTAVEAVAELPLTVHGKVDVDALPDPRPAGGEAGAPPRTAQEETLCALFADSLGHGAVGRDADFFELGGHSLLATRLASRIRTAFGVELPVRALFEARTPAALARRLDGAAAARPAVRPADRTDRVPLSHAQRRLWFLHRMDPQDPSYNLPIAVRLAGTPDVEALHAALADVVSRHETLRTSVHDPAATDPASVTTASGAARTEILQVVGEPGAGPSLSRTTTTAAALPGELRTAAARPFDLTTELPLRAELFTTAPDRHVLLLTVHHIAADGWSMGPLAQDLARAYAARAEGRAPSWEPLPVQYADYALWQRELLGSAADSQSLISRQLAHWKGVLADLPEEMPLPVDRVRSVGSVGGGGGVSLVVSPEVHGRVVALGRESGVSVFMVVHAALSALLCRLGGGSDVVVGSPVAGRSDEALAGLVGFFVNTLVLRADVSGDPSFRELLGRVREVDLAAYGNQDVPFERLVEEVGPVRSPARHPLFQVMLALNNTERPRLELPGLHAEVEGVDTGGAKFDLSFSFTGQAPTAGPAEDGGLEGTLEFSRDLFDTDTAQDIADRFLRLLEQAVADPDTPVSRLDLLSGPERETLRALGDGGAGPAEQATLIDRFDRSVREAGAGALAVTAPDGSLTFSELDARSEALAHWLHDRGVTAGDVVAVRVPRSTDSIAALLAVLKSGAVYAPVDPALPSRRVRAVLEDAGPVLVLTTTAAAADLPPGTAVGLLDEPRTAAAIAERSGVRLGRRPRARDAAYLLHTSGSTGRPKGVLVEHRSLGRLFDHHRRHLFTPAAGALNVALTASLSFDASWDPVQWMVAGHVLHVVDDLVRRDPEALVDHVRAHGIDVLETTPTHLRQLLDAGLLDPDAPHRPSHLALGGEAVPPALWRRLREAPGLTCWNLYGPTETTVDTLEALLTDTPGPVLGRPVTGTRAHVLDDRLGLAPIGVPGELYLGGDSLARGYFDRPAETATRFLPDPYGPAGERMYRTGDLVRRTRSGDLEFLGRADSQVQVRGFRVEPEEVSAVLEKHPAVARAAVVLDADETAGGRLLACLVPSSASTGEGNGEPSPAGDGGIDTDAVREHAACFLPDYMVPSLWTVLEALPLTASGKLDRSALPAPTVTGRPRGRGPRNPREEMLCTLFAETLGREQVGADEDFFALGGHSLLATGLIGRIRQVLGVELGIRALFESPTVEALAARLETDAEEDSLAVLLPLRTSGDRRPLFCFPPASGISWCYTGFLRHLDPGQPLYGLQSPVLRGEAPYPSDMAEMAEIYIRAIRSVQPHGPYRLLGWSFGGNVAHEAAVLLRRAGEEVELLALLDAFPLAPQDGLEDADRDTVFRALLVNLGIEAAALESSEAVDASVVRRELLRTGNPLGALEPATIDAMVENFAGQARVMRHHTPGVLDRDVLFFTATEGRTEAASGPQLWAPYVTGRFDNHNVPFAHARLTEPGATEHIVPLLAAALRALPDEPTA